MSFAKLASNTINDVARDTAILRCFNTFRSVNDIVTFMIGPCCVVVNVDDAVSW